MRFSFNMGSGEDATNKLAEMCKQYYQCQGCPVMKNGAIQIDNTPVSCSTAIIKNIQRQAGKNV